MKKGWIIGTAPTSLTTYNSFYAKNVVELTGSTNAKIRKMQMEKLEEILYIDTTTNKEVAKRYQIKGIIETSNNKFSVYLGQAIDMTTSASCFNGTYSISDVETATINTAETIVSFPKTITLKFTHGLTKLEKIDSITTTEDKSATTEE